MSFAARMTDQTLREAPHCHATIHPPAPTPTPVPHPALPLAIISGMFTVLVGGQPAAQMMSQTAPCSIAPCVPAGPGMVMQAAPTVMAGTFPMARVGDMVLHSSCVAPIPSPMGKILPPGCPTVIVG